jgi:hypothetical protein
MTAISLRKPQAVEQEGRESKSGEEEIVVVVAEEALRTTAGVGGG